MRRLVSPTQLLMIVASLASAGIGAAMAAEAPSTLLLIDGSGSMWGRFEADKRAKIDVVRELLLPKIDAATGQPIGLASFGHRRKSDCSDVEVIAAPNADHTALFEPLAKLNPRGKGPLVAGLRAAIGSLGQGRPASVIVIGDGIDNCQQDTCSAAAELATSAPGVAIHMISIGVDPAELPRLSCVAKATSGSFFDVKDSTELASAIDAATKLAMLSDGQVPAASAAPSAPAPQPTATDGSVKATAVLVEGGAELSSPLHWRIYKSGTSDVVAESDATSNIAARLDPGSYDIEADAGTLRARQTVMVEAGRSLGVIVPLNAARLKVTVKSDKAGSTASAPLITIAAAPDATAPNDVSWIGRQAGATLLLPAGAYTVVAASGSISQSKPVSLTAGGDASLEFSLGTGRLELSAGLREDGGAIENVTYAISEDDPDSPDGRREVARSSAAVAEFTLPAGTYYVSARAGDGEVRQRIAVGAGDIVKRALILPLVPVKISTIIAGQPVTASQGLVYRVTALDGDRKDIARSVFPELSLQLLPGRYRVAARLGAQRIKADEIVTIEAGKNNDVVLKIDAAEVTFKLGAQQFANPGDAYWEIVDVKGLPVWHTMAAEPKAILPPGRYTVTLDIRDKRTQAAFEVHSGERKVVQIGQN